jgi:proteic killer suppression protein
VIRTFRHRGLKALYEKGKIRGLNPDWIRRIRAILARLDASAEPTDMALPGLRLHPLKGRYQGFWAVDVSGNWRIIFQFVDGDASDVDLIDYH